MNEMGCLAELMIVSKDTLASLIIVYDRNQVFWFTAETKSKTENGCTFRYDTKIIDKDHVK